MTDSKGKKNLSQDGRQLAIEALIRVERDGAYANRVLHALFLRWNPPAAPRANATDWVYGTLRHMTRVDHFLSLLLKKPLADMTPALRNLLRLAIYQLDVAKEPAYAVVDQSVSLAKIYGHEGVARLVNGVLRSFLRQSASLALPSFREEPVRHMVVAHSHPEWLISAWIKAYGIERTHAIALLNNTPAPLSLRVNSLRNGREEIIAELLAAEIPCEASFLLPEALRLLRGSALERFPPLVEGRGLVQDLGAMIISHLVNPAPDESIVDLCAAPGGKTTHMAELMGNRGRIQAVDQFPEKTRRIADSADRLGLTIIETVTGDARAWQPDEPVDAVLLDAPCSGTGVIRRRPDMRWRRQPEDIEELIILQRELLASAARMLRPGGRLIYSTCSIQKEENEEQSAWFLGNFPQFEQGDAPDFFKSIIENPALEQVITPEGFLLFPAEGNDGFFMTIFHRKNE